METSFGTLKGLKLRCKLIFILTYGSEQLCVPNLVSEESKYSDSY